MEQTRAEPPRNHVAGRRLKVHGQRFSAQAPEALEIETKEYS